MPCSPGGTHRGLGGLSRDLGDETQDLRSARGRPVTAEVPHGAFRNSAVRPLVLMKVYGGRVTCWANPPWERGVPSAPTGSPRPHWPSKRAPLSKAKAPRPAGSPARHSPRYVTATGRWTTTSKLWNRHGATAGWRGEGGSTNARPLADTARNASATRSVPERGSSHRWHHPIRTRAALVRTCHPSYRPASGPGRPPPRRSP